MSDGRGNLGAKATGPAEADAGSRRAPGPGLMAAFTRIVRLSRPPTLAASVVPVAVGTVAGALAGPVNGFYVADMAIVALLLQAGTNMINEVYDFHRGIDDPESEGIAGVIVKGEMDPDAVWRTAVTTFLVAIAFGITLAFLRGPLLFVLGFLSVGVAFLYNAGPMPISQTPFGELTVFLVMGPLEVAVSEVAAIGHVTATGLWASLPVAALVAAILLANNLRDRVKDAERGRRTLPVLFGPDAGQGLMRGLLAVALGGPAVMWLAGVLPASSMIVLLGAPAALALLKALCAGGASLKPAVALAARTELAAGVLLTIGLLLGRPTG